MFKTKGGGVNGNNVEKTAELVGGGIPKSTQGKLCNLIIFKHISISLILLHHRYIELDWLCLRRSNAQWEGDCMHQLWMIRVKSDPPPRTPELEYFSSSSSSSSTSSYWRFVVQSWQLIARSNTLRPNTHSQSLCQNNVDGSKYILCLFLADLTFWTKTNVILCRRK